MVLKALCAHLRHADITIILVRLKLYSGKNTVVQCYQSLNNHKNHLERVDSSPALG